MRIYNDDSDKALDEIFIYLTPLEIDELISKLKFLLKNQKANHIHLNEIDSNNEISSEITLSIYTKDNLNDFDERSRRLIIEGI